MDFNLADVNGEDLGAEDSVGAKKRPAGNTFGDDDSDDDVDMDKRSNQGM
jgi:hypothetical protein